MKWMALWVLFNALYLRTQALHISSILMATKVGRSGKHTYKEILLI
jgi:hypothetical protein